MIVVVDYGMGNLGSILNMLKKIRTEAVVSSSIRVIERADKLILPGVGAFDNGMANLKERHLIPVLNRKVLEEGTPILGLCLGMQLFTRRSEEGQLPGLGWIAADTVRFRIDPSQSPLKVPHMGWNEVRIRQDHPIWRELSGEPPSFYFVHSYHVSCDRESTVLATTQYGYEFASAVVKDSIVGTQFHPEKSHSFGMKLLRGFGTL